MKTSRTTTNKQFNTAIKDIYYTHTSDDDVIAAVGDFWLANTTTDKQDIALESIKTAAHLGHLSSIESFLLKEVIS